MRCAIFSLGLMLLMVGCNEHRAGHSESDQRATNEQNESAGAASASPKFSVSVRLSDAARKKLLDSKETIIVAGYLTVHPKQGTELSYLDIKSGLVSKKMLNLLILSTFSQAEVSLAPPAVLPVVSKSEHLLRSPL